MLGSRSAARTLPGKGFCLDHGRPKLASYRSIISKISYGVPRKVEIKNLPAHISYSCALKISTMPRENARMTGDIVYG